MIYRYKQIRILMCFLIGAITSHGQLFTVEKGNIVYESSGKDADSSLKRKYSILCDHYISSYYHKKKLPLVYLIITTSTSDSLIHELSYDNLSGYSSSYKYYGANEKYNQPGVRIKIYSNQDESENILKLLDYGINNLKELKRIRKRALKGDGSLSLSEDGIKRILEKPVTDKIKAVLRK